MSDKPPLPTKILARVVVQFKSGLLRGWNIFEDGDWSIRPHDPDACGMPTELIIRPHRPRDVKVGVLHVHIPFDAIDWYNIVRPPSAEFTAALSLVDPSLDNVYE